LPCNHQRAVIAFEAVTASLVYLYRLSNFCTSFLGIAKLERYFWVLLGKKKLVERSSFVTMRVKYRPISESL
jgi:hypothetical protein